MNTAWYVIATLRDSCLGLHLQTLRRYYPHLPVYVVDNCMGQFDLSPIAAEYQAELLSNGSELVSLTCNQQRWSALLFQRHDLLCFSSDDIEILEGGFIELAEQRIAAGAEIVSFSTDADPVAYMYTQRFAEQVGWNTELLGKEDTDTDLRKRVYKHYGCFESVGEYWRNRDHSWHSRYVLNPRLGVNGKTDVNRQIEALGQDSGVISNRGKIL